MKPQHKLIISLGSNSGDRLQNIQKCLTFISAEIGEIAEISKLYQSPAWGFKSDDFYNCALALYTNKTPTEVLETALDIENKMGRIRSNPKEYQPRTIDIDIIAYDNEIINTAELTIPHPHLQNRKFVLFPLKDLDAQWTHPLLNKSVIELIAICEDNNGCDVVAELYV